MSDMRLHPRRKLVMRARADISAAILGAIKLCDLTRPELMMILSQEMLACAGAWVTEERQEGQLADEALDCFAPPRTIGTQPHAFQLIDNRYCPLCGGGRLHPIHQEAEQE